VYFRATDSGRSQLVMDGRVLALFLRTSLRELAIEPTLFKYNRTIEGISA